MDNLGHGAIAGGRRVFFTVNLAVAIVISLLFTATKIGIIAMGYFILVCFALQLSSIKIPEFDIVRQYKRGFKALIKVTKGVKRA